MTVDVVIEAPDWRTLALEALAGRAAGATLKHLGLDPGRHEIALLATDDARMAALNAAFRGKERATNVLSWPSAERGAAADGGAPAPPDAAELGDIALGYATCAAEAASAGRALSDHVAHLVVHGVLHLLGYDHERPGDAALMERLEVEILATMGIPDPYRDEADGR